jgi:hypothetical protein
MPSHETSEQTDVPNRRLQIRSKFFAGVGQIKAAFGSVLQAAKAEKDAQWLTKAARLRERRRQHAIDDVDGLSPIYFHA